MSYKIPLGNRAVVTQDSITSQFFPSAEIEPCPYGEQQFV